MKSLPHITKILKVEPFKIYLLWNDFEIRGVDFIPLFLQWEQEGNTDLLCLKDFQIFKHVHFFARRSLRWINFPFEQTVEEQTQAYSVELDPEFLFQNSQLIRQVDRISLGAVLRNARLAAGLSPKELALKAGTTAYYINRAENEQAGIQFDTFQKIIELGLGRKVKLEII